MKRSLGASSRRPGASRRPSGQVGAAALVVAVAAACRSAPPPELTRALTERATPSRLARRSLRLTSRGGAGPALALEGMIVHRGPRFRLELFPPLGGRALAMWSDPEGLLARLDGDLAEWAGERELRLGPADAPDTALGALGRTLARLLAPVEPSEVTGAERHGEGWRLELRAFGGLDVEARLDAELRPQRFRFARLGASWDATRRAGRWRVRADERVLDIELGPPSILPDASEALLARPEP